MCGRTWCVMSLVTPWTHFQWDNYLHQGTDEGNEKLWTEWDVWWRERESDNQHNTVCVWCWICCNLNISDLGVSDLQHSLVHLNNSHFRLILDEISKSLLSPHTNIWSTKANIFAMWYFAMAYFPAQRVCVCVMGWWRLIWVMIQLVHHHTPRTARSAYMGHMGQRRSLGRGTRRCVSYQCE